MICNQVHKYLSGHCLISSRSVWYLETLTSIDCALSVKNDILRHMNDEKSVGFVLLDLKTTFDTVNHTIYCDIFI